jgi:hypothetical protein
MDQFNLGGVNEESIIYDECSHDWNMLAEKKTTLISVNIITRLNDDT